MSILPETDSRALIVGRTGSGKTTGAVWILRRMRLPLLIYDTKIEPKLEKAAREGEQVKIIEDLGKLQTMSKSRAVPDVVIIRPPASVLADPAELDNWLIPAYDGFGACTVYIDEAYSFHNAGRAGPGLIALLTRGRSRKKAVILSTQRPTWISRFCLSEADSYFIYALNDQRDRKTLGEVIPGFEALSPPPRFHFWYYKIRMEGARLYAPFPTGEIPDNDEDESPVKKWL